MYTLDNFYRSRAWNEFRWSFLGDELDKKGEIKCSNCQKSLLRKNDIILHHITHLTESNVNDYSISLNPQNIKILCFDCHNSAHSRFGHNHEPKKEKKCHIVFGPPLSGKIEYIKENAEKNDLIIDVDRLYDAISINREESLLSVVMDIRRLLIDKAKYKSIPGNVWLVATMAKPNELERLKKELNADFIIIEEKKETLIERAKRLNQQNLITHINSYFDNLEEFKFLYEALTNEYQFN